MKKLVLATLFLLSSPALAGSYDDFSEGISAHEIAVVERGTPALDASQDDLVIADMSRALAVGDLAIGLQPTAYMDRAIAYLHKDQCALALADLNMVIKLRPHYLEAVADRSIAEICLAQNDAAFADLAMLAAAKPTGATLHRVGHVQWLMGNFASANDTFKKSLQLDPRRPYTLLWLGISQMRNKNFDADAFAGYLSAMSVDKWPRPIFDLFLGKTTLAAMVDAASADAQDIAGHKCEADFYGGEWQLVHGDVATSKAMFQEAVNICPKTFEELPPARLELKRLQQTPG